MDTKLITKIFTPMIDGKWKLGTGYPIAKDLVLTARHVIDFPERDTKKSILLKWTDYDYAFGEQEGENTEIAFNGGHECDIAIIKCKMPSQAHVSTSILAHCFPTAHEEWEGFGYGEIGVNETTGSHDKVSLLGKFHPADETSHIISLTTESDALNKNDWQGVSGAPVFHKNILYAVISKTPQNRQECFKAVSIPHLLIPNSPTYNKIFCESLKQSIDEAIEEQNQILQNIIKSNLKRLLQENFDETILKACLKLPNISIDGIVDYLLVDENNKPVSVLDSISTLTMILESHSPKNIENMREMSGWLLLNSVDSTWWFHNQQRMQHVTGAFGLENPDYIEVIISRSLFRPAQYALYEKHGNHPKPCHHNGSDFLSPLVYDNSSKATGYESLKPIYLDLWGIAPPSGCSNSFMLDEIINKASSKCRVLDKLSKGKIIYYLVDQEHLKQLESEEWFAEKQEALANCLRFICCNPIGQSAGQNPCYEGQGAILAQLSELLEKLNNLAK